MIFGLVETNQIQFNISKMNINYKLFSELSEAQIETDVSSYLGYITPFWSERLQLKAVDEQSTGADKLFDKFIPIYLQFKVSQGLKPLPIHFSLSSPRRPLNRIRIFRRKNNFNLNPILYFKLRDKAHNANNFQHNILKSFHNPPNQYALYIAPLTLSIIEYNQLLNASIFERLFSFDPFFYTDEELYIKSRKVPLGFIPFLKGHISIPPYEDVTTSEHYYSYSKFGSDVVWHSDTKIQGDFRLSTQFNKIFQHTIESKDTGFYKVEFIRFIDSFFNFKNPESNYSENSYDYRIIQFAQHLKSEYNIKLLLLETK
jgi:hypothetical protein